MKNPKPRSDSLYAALSKKQRQELFDELLGGLHTAKAVEKCAAWSVKTSAAAVSRFYSQRLWQEQVAIAKEEAEHFGQTEVFDQATTAAIKQKIFRTVMGAEIEPKHLIGFRALQQEDEKIELAKQRTLSKRDAGLQALYEEIKDNPKALELFEQLKGALKKK